MQRSSWYHGILGGVAALVVAVALATGGYFAGRSVMASRLGDRIATAGSVAERATAASPVNALPASAAACDRLRRGQRIDRQIRQLIELLEGYRLEGRESAI